MSDVHLQRKKLSIVVTLVNPLKSTEVSFSQSKRKKEPIVVTLVNPLISIEVSASHVARK